MLGYLNYYSLSNTLILVNSLFIHSTIIFSLTQHSYSRLLSTTPRLPSAIFSSTATSSFYLAHTQHRKSSRHHTSLSSFYLLLSLTLHNSINHFCLLQHLMMTSSDDFFRRHLSASVRLGGSRRRERALGFPTARCSQLAARGSHVHCCARIRHTAGCMTVPSTVSVTALPL